MTTTAETGNAPGAAPGDWEAAASVRAARLEARLGDPYDPANPHGLRALFAADDRRTPPRETEELLDDTGLAAEFVPVGYGGRLTRADLLARTLRPVFRRDVALGFGHGITSLFAIGAVWAAGSEEQRRPAADGRRSCTTNSPTPTPSCVTSTPPLPRPAAAISSPAART
jgi:alkylation response protein AidB-like acyl-CoA dehydrogenase